MNKQVEEIITYVSGLKRAANNGYTPYYQGRERACDDILEYINNMQKKQQKNKYSWFTCVLAYDGFKEGKTYRVETDDQDVSWITDDDGKIWKYDWFLGQKFRPARKDELPTEPKFKVGDKIHHKLNNDVVEVLRVGLTHYSLSNDVDYPIDCQDDWQLVDKYSESEKKILRCKYAGMAMQGFCSQYSSQGDIKTAKIDIVAEVSVMMADALIKELNK